MDPSDSEAFQRIYLRMNRYISKAMVENALQHGIKHSVIDAIIKHNTLKPFQVIKLQELTKEFKALARMTPPHALQVIEHDFKYFASIKDYCDHTGLSFDYLYSLFGVLKTLSESCKTLQ
ncbi:MAG: ATP-dependent helicase, partial [Clostridia bacterium]|nr:ATP-dependent helicase [Clostridia bacterium]